MVRLLGLNLPDDKRVEYALTLFYGLSWGRVGRILNETGIDKNKRMNQLSEGELKKITQTIEKNYQIEGELREQVTDNIKRQKEMNSYIGSRHSKSLPVRGQRTRSNARTKRGKRKTVGALKKETWAQMDQQKQPEAKS